MKKIKLITFSSLLLASIVALAARIGDNTLQVGDTTSANKTIQMGDGRLIWDGAAAKLKFSNNAGVSQKDIGSGGGAGGGINIIENFDFESGSPTPDNWTASGGTFTAESSAPIFGEQSGSWDSNASSQTLRSSLISLDPLYRGLVGQRCLIEMYYRWPSGVSGDISMQALDDTAAVLATINLDPTVGNNTRVAQINFDCPTDPLDGLRFQLISNVTNAAAIVIDNAFVGTGKNNVNISQTTFVGRAVFAGTTNCVNWTLSSTSLSAFSADADCPGPTVVSNPGPGVILTTDSDLPRVTVTNLPPGRYMVSFDVSALQSSPSNVPAFAINDGVTTSTAISGSSGEVNVMLHVTGIFTYTAAQPTKTFELYGAVSAGSLTVLSEILNTRNLVFTIVKYPLNAAEALTLETSYNSWSGYHDADCSWGTTSTTLGEVSAGDASCTFAQVTNNNFGTVASYTISSNNAPGVVFTPKQSGAYEICAMFEYVNSAAANYSLARLVDGSSNEISTLRMRMASSAGVPMTLCGLVNVSSLSSFTAKLFLAVSAGTGTINQADVFTGDRAIFWTIKPQSQQLPAPVFTELQNIMKGGTSGLRTLTAFITNTGTPVITRQDGTWITSLTDNAVGDTTLNLAVGAFSSAPNCVVSIVEDDTDSRFAKVRTQTTGGVRIITIQDSAGLTDNDFSVHCTGPQ